MKKMMLMGVVAGLSSAAFAGLYGDTPDAKHAWSVHDMHRPNPVKVTPAKEVGQPPSDAVVLFDGTKESFEKNWTDGNGKPCRWQYKPEEKAFALVLQAKGGQWQTGAGIAQTREEFADCQLHLEFRYPADITGAGQMRGNSGVFLMKMHEIQLMESFGTDPAAMKNPNYADGQCGAIYAETPPLVNANRKPGEWQSYDIVFHRPVWKAGVLVHPGTVTLFHNGVLVQDHWELEGLTTHCKRRPYAEYAEKAPLFFQDHGCPISIRNVWYRPLASRWANTTHSCMSGVEADVMALRRETAAKLYAAIPDKESVSCANAAALAEVVAYAKEGEYDAQWRKIATALAEELGKKGDDELKKMQTEITMARRASDVLFRNKIVTDKCVLRQRLLEICNKFQWK